MTTKTFKKDYLLDILGTKNVIEDEITDTSRWSIYHNIIFLADDGLYYSTNYSVGATEYQDESPFENEEDNIECEQVHQVEKLVKVWEII